MRNNADSSIDRCSGVIRISSNKWDNVLDKEEEQGDDNSNFWSGQEDLNEEVLNDNDNVKEDEEDERYNEGNIW